MNYDLTDLKLFTAVAEAGSLSRGATQMHLAISSASHRISRLENSVGAKLFERRARGVSLTRAGVIMLSGTREVLARLEQLHADLLPYATGIVGQVSLWANTNAINVFLPLDLPDFLSMHPQLRVSLREAASPEIIGAVASGEAELGVFAGQIETGELVVAPYRNDRLVLISPKIGAVTPTESTWFADLARMPFITLANGTGIHTFLMAKAAELGITLDVRIQVQSFQAVLNMVSAGTGLGLVPLSCLCETDEVHIISLKDSWAERNLRLCWRSETRLSHYARQLINHLVQPTQATY